VGYKTDDTDKAIPLGWHERTILNRIGIGLPDSCGPLICNTDNDLAESAQAFPLHREHCRLLRTYFLIIRLGGMVSVGGAGEMTNVGRQRLL
jgi:hypothetical protein